MTRLARAWMSPVARDLRAAGCGSGPRTPRTARSRTGPALMLAAAVIMLCAAAPATWAAGQTFTIRWADAWVADNPNGKADQDFVDALNGQSQGRLQVTLYHNSLGAPAVVIPAVQSGSIQMMTVGASNVSQYVPVTGALSLPFLFADEDSAFRALDGPAGQAVAQELSSKNLVLVAWYFSGFADFFNVVRPIRQVQDVKGLRLRVVNDPIQIAMVKALGAIPVPLDPAEVYPAIQNHVVDGVVNAPGPMYSTQVTSVTKYQSIVNAVLFVNVVTMNKSFYAGLPADLQQLLGRLGPMFSRRQRSYEAESEATVAKAIVAQGNAVNTVAPADLQGFRTAVAPVYDYARTLYGASLVSTLQAAAR